MNDAQSIPGVSARASATAKTILFGEHAVNRGQMGIAAALGLHARCALTLAGQTFSFEGAGRSAVVSRADLLDLRHQVDLWREAQDLEAIRRLAATDFFAPQKYIIAHAYGSDLPAGLSARFESQIPPSSGLGSGGAAFAALARALAQLLGGAGARQIGEWAWLGDVIAHGGVASALDSQTSLHGGVIRYTREGLGEPIPFDPSLTLVVAHTGVGARTSEINTRVRSWLAGDATRMRYFEMIGALSLHALEAIARGDWTLVGKLMNINQLVLEKIGVSCPELDRLIRAALAAGAFGAKLSGSGGGGIMVALATAESRDRIAEALREAGASVVFQPDIAPRGVFSEIQT